MDTSNVIRRTVYDFTTRTNIIQFVLTSDFFVLFFQLNDK